MFLVLADHSPSGIELAVMRVEESLDDAGFKCRYGVCGDANVRRQADLLETRGDSSATHQTAPRRCQAPPELAQPLAGRIASVIPGF